MPQIIPSAPRQQTTGDRFAQAFSNLGQSAGTLIPEELLGRKERQSIGKMIGQDVSDIRNPDFLKQIYSQEMKRKESQEDLSNGLLDYDTVKKFAGQDVADFYKAAPVGGKTKIVQAIIEGMQRGEKFGDTLGQAANNQPQENQTPDIEQIVSSSDQGENGKINLPDYNKRPQGFTPQEWAKNRTEWGKKNNETLMAAKDRLKGNKRDILGTKKLQKLSENLPQGLERLIINPSTGEPYKLAQLTEKSPTAAQEWVKEISRFGNRAKDAFGSRVTNFDLYQYMKQFPSLLNSKEGRDNILRMMEINYDLDSLYDKAVQRIVDQKGSSNIPPEEVDRVARGLIKQRENELFDEYLNIESKNEQSFMQEGTEGNKPSLEEIFG